MDFSVSPRKSSDIGSLFSRKADLLRSIFTLLLIQIAITGIVAHFVPYTKPDKKSTANKMTGAQVAVLILVIVALIAFLWFAIGIIMNPALPAYVRIGMFTVISGIFGYFLRYVKTISQDIIIMAGSLTAGAFVVMGGLGYFIASKNVDLSPMGGFLCGALLVLIICSIIAFIAFPKEPLIRKILTIIAVVIFSLYIMYDANQVLMRDIDYIEGAFSFYLDIINIFQDILSLLSEDF